MKTKAVFFDFDGTITHKASINIWKALYQNLGLDTSKNSSYYQSYVDYINKKYDYQEWCNVAANDYKTSGLTEKLFYNIAKDVRLYDDAISVFEELAHSDIKLFVVSGNFVQLIKFSLGENLKYFEDISGNEIIFDKSGKIEKIVGTNYDFEGKANYIKVKMKEFDLKPSEVVFVGNGDNDLWAYQSGVKTICINPDNASEENREIWHCLISNTESLSSILKYID